MRRIAKAAGVLLAVVFVLSQFVRPARTNPATDPARNLLHIRPVPAHVAIRARSGLPRLSFERHALAVVQQRGACVLVRDRPRQPWAQSFQLFRLVSLRRRRRPAAARDRLPPGARTGDATVVVHVDAPPRAPQPGRRRRPLRLDRRTQVLNPVVNRRREPSS